MWILDTYYPFMRTKRHAVYTCLIILQYKSPILNRSTKTLNTATTHMPHTHHFKLATSRLPNGAVRRTIKTILDKKLLD